MKAVFLLERENFERIYSKKTIEKISSKVDILGCFESIDVKEDLSDVEVVFSGWGSVPIDEKALSRIPKLKLVLYGAGSIKKVQTDYMWDKGVRISSAALANAVPVAQYSLSLIQLLLKDFFKLSTLSKDKRKNKMDVHKLTKGFYNRNIGIISYSKVGKKLIENLQNISNNNIYVYDPYYDGKYFEERGLTKASLKEIFSKCDVISLHSPLVKDTEYMLGYEHFSLMKENAAFINTARGKIIKTDELIEVFSERKDLTAVLDVTDPEPLNERSALYDMENVILTPHIAGSLGNETHLMGEYMYEELDRFLKGDDLKYEITRHAFERMA